MAKKVPSKKTTKSKKNTVSKNDKVKFDEQLKHLDDSLKNEKDKYLRLFAEFENFKKRIFILKQYEHLSKVFLSRTLFLMP